MPPGGWAPPKPTSGKAVASLICGLAGPVAAFLCAPLGVAVLVGLVLGILGIVETGKNGSRAGRGMAIAGTSISALAVVATVAIFVGFMAMWRAGEEQSQQYQQEQLAEDADLIAARVQQYCLANDKSLGPGGPVLADSASAYPAGTAPVANSPNPSGLTVSGSLELSHLVSENELKYGHNRGGGAMGGWELIINGQTSATIRHRSWDGEVIWEEELSDTVRGLRRRTVP